MTCHLCAKQNCIGECEPTMTSNEKMLPPLPEFHGYIGANDIDSDAGEEGYTADQMRERDAMWLAKIAVLSNRQEDFNLLGEVRNGQVIWFGKNPHAFENDEGTKFYALPANTDDGKGK